MDDSFLLPCHDTMFVWCACSWRVQQWPGGQATTAGVGDNCQQGNYNRVAAANAAPLRVIVSSRHRVSAVPPHHPTAPTRGTARPAKVAPRSGPHPRRPCGRRCWAAVGIAKLFTPTYLFLYFYESLYLSLSYLYSLHIIASNKVAGSNNRNPTVRMKFQKILISAEDSRRASGECQLQKFVIVGISTVSDMDGNREEGCLPKQQR